MNVSENDNIKKFLSTAVHDIREPIRTIKSFSSIAKNDLEDNDINSALEDMAFIDSAVDRLSDLVEKLNMYFRVQQSKFYRTDINVVELFEQVLSNFEAAIKKKDATIDYQLSSVVKADYDQMLMLLTELISNSLKFNKNKPKITITDDNEDDQYHLLIRDNGVGIEEEFIAKLGTAFYRTVSKEEYPGAGLGLTISRLIVDNHNGSIKIESKYGEGTVVRLTFPM